MKRCAGITQAGAACKAAPLNDSDYCINHHPDQAQARKLRARRGGKAGGRGRSSTQLAAIKAEIQSLIQNVVDGELDRAVGAVAFQGYNVLLKAYSTELSVREQEELVQQVEQLEEALSKYSASGARTGYGA